MRTAYVRQDGGTYSAQGPIQLYLSDSLEAIVRMVREAGLRPVFVLP